MSVDDLIRSAYRCVELDDIDAIVDLLHPEVVCIEPPEFPMGGTHRGRSAAADYFRTSRSIWSSLTCTLLDLELAPDGGLAVVEHRGVLRRTDTEHGVTVADIIDVDHFSGLITAVRGYADPTEGRMAWAARQVDR